MKKGLAGAALGSLAGLAVIAILHETLDDPNEGVYVVSYALTQSLITAYFSGR